MSIVVFIRATVTWHPYSRIDHWQALVHDLEPVSIVNGHWPRFVASGPDDVRATLEQMVEESDADEVMVQDSSPTRPPAATSTS
ncbi:hypothetical protein [Ornithinimicrobium sufpigmenti]|uniref:hypothetical protein n=1 Tax=Ornithinimicrobium sufpigmenti TaxID=2508882 RepID=UPI00192E0B68|nr:MULTISPECIES: hypothetical protein [unclassified Ornithinimicrobium]